MQFIQRASRHTGLGSSARSAWRQTQRGTASSSGASAANEFVHAASPAVPSGMVFAASTAATSDFDTVEIEKPATDYRVYRAARLPNNMRVMVVSDERCDRAASALSVRVGSIFDPPQIPGLAHFCEHMLFLGNEKYPKENEYNEYLSEHGGGSNAYTAETVTNYFFSVRPEALDGALDRFAQFFMAPLFTESATQRELNAVDSEHSKNVQQDGWRNSQLLRSLVQPGHPLNHFITGNSETLRDAPEKQGIDVRAALLDFHDRYYSANLMTLVIVGRESPEELLALAHRHFAAVADRAAVVAKDAEIAQGIEPFPPDRRGRLIRVVPINDVRSASFQFVLPGQRPHWRSKPTLFMSHLLGHEGEGSLLTALKVRGLATELSAGTALDEAGVSLFMVTVVLTEAGEANIAEVGELIFAFIQLMREHGPDAQLWEEMRRLSEIGFYFRSVSDSLSTASGLAQTLQEHEPEFALSAEARLWDYEPQLIVELVSQLTCDNLRLVLSSKAQAELCDQQERWYGTRFADESLGATMRERWSAPKPAEDLRMPSPNPFVPEDLQLRPAEVDGVPPFPEQLPLGFHVGDTPADRVATAFFRKDEAYGLPKAGLAVNVYSPFTAEGVEQRELTELWCLAVREELNEFAYDAQIAGLTYSLVATSSGVSLSFFGYNDKMLELISSVAQKMARLSEVSEHTYTVVKTVLERDLTNAAARSQPYQQAFREEACMVQSPAHTLEERLAALRSVDRASLNGVNRRVFDACHLECLVQGNLTTDEARGIVQSILESLAVARPLERLPPVGTAALSPGWTLMKREGSNPEERNGAVVVSVQIADDSLMCRCLTQLTAKIVSQRFFDELRTKQQLGYIVSASAFRDRGCFVGLRLIVQSEQQPDFVLGQMRAWTDDEWTFLESGLGDAEFLKYRAALVSQIRERPKSLQEEFERHWAEVSSRSFAFSAREEMAVCIESLALQELQQFVSEKIRSAPAVGVLVAGKEHQMDLTVSAERHFSPDDVAQFRREAVWRHKNADIHVPSQSTPPSRL